MRDKLIFFLTLLAITQVATAQKVVVRGGFIQDHFEIGDPISFWLTATYPEGTELVFPDSTYDFSPFEYFDKKYYPSKKLASGQVYDTAIYTFQCYEIDPLQYLSLPAIVLSKGDSSLFYTKPDSILFHHLATEVSDTTQLKTNLNLADVRGQFNFPLLWIILGTLIVLSIAAFLIFGKSVMRTIKLRKLRKDYSKFSEELTLYIRKLKTTPEHTIAEKAINEWKNFVERLENKPYSKMTTKEILSFGYTGELADTLKNIDRCVYARKNDENIYKYFQNIEDFTQHRYSVVVDEIKNGK